MARRRPRKRSRTRFSLVSIALLLAALSIVEFSETGSLQWPGQLQSAAQRLAADAPQQTPGETLQQTLSTGRELLAQAEQRVAEAPQQAAATGTGSTSSTGSTGNSTAAPAGLLTGEAVNITDGDTFTLRYSSLEDERVRLYGIDAPERDQPHGREAGAALARLIEGRTVGVELVERDNYGRLVARVWADDVDVNLALVQAGHAWWYEYYAQDSRELEQAEDAARRAQLGLWQQRNPVPPWEWRRNRR